MNWFARHLNWSTLGVAMAFYLTAAALCVTAGPVLTITADLAGLAVVVAGPAFLMPTHLHAMGGLAWGTGASWVVVAVATYAWVKIAGAKGRDGAWGLLPLAIPFGWIALMVLHNRRTDSA